MKITISGFLFVSALFLLPSFYASCQSTKFPEGGYKSIKEIQTRHPSVELPYKIILRNSQEILNKGGNDYRAEFQDTIKERWHKDSKIYAVSFAGKLYLNGIALKLPPGFMDVIEEGPYLLFQCATPRAKKQVIVSAGSSGNTHIKGMSVNVNDDGKLIRKKIYYCLETATGEVKILDKVYLMNKLEKYPDHNNMFLKDPDNTKMEVLVDYFKLLNTK